MLRGIRKASSNWLGKGVMAVVMGLLILSFAVWGIGDIFRGFGRATVAQIGSTEITIEQFRQFYTERLQQLGRRIGRPLTPDQARSLGLDRQLLGQLVTEAVLNERVRQLRLGLPDAVIAARITEDPNFRGALGQFDRVRFEQLIRGAGYTEPRYVAEQRQVLLRRQIAEAIGGQIAAPKTMIDAMNRYEGEERAIEYLVLDAARAGDISPPAPEVLAKYFEERKALFRAPEYRKLVVLTVSPVESARWITVSDDDARKTYQDQRARYTTPERRHIQQIVFPNAAEARASADRLKQGTVTFEALATERGLKDTDIDLGTLTKAEMLDPALANAAFALKEGEISEPVEGRFATAIARIAKIEPGAERSFEEVAPQIKRDLALERGRAEMASLHDKVEDEIAGGQQLAEVAKKLNLTPHVVEAVDRSGRDANGVPVRELAGGVDILTGAFASDVGVENEPVRMPDGGYLWYEVAGATPAHDRNLDEIKERVETRWRDEQVAERLQAKASELADRINKGAPPAEIATAENLKVEAASALKRGKAAEALPAELVDVAFRTAKNVAAVGPGQKTTERIVLRVTDVKVPVLDPASDEAKRVDETLRRAYADDLLVQYITRLQSEMRVTINEAALRQVVGGETN